MSGSNGSRTDSSVLTIQAISSGVLINILKKKSVIFNYVPQDCARFVLRECTLHEDKDMIENENTNTEFSVSCLLIIVLLVGVSSTYN